MRNSQRLKLRQVSDAARDSAAQLVVAKKPEMTLDEYEQDAVGPFVSQVFQLRQAVSDAVWNRATQCVGVEVPEKVWGDTVNYGHYCLGMEGGGRCAATYRV